eukprot:1061615-Rhodomonas_salina.3
MPCQYRAPHSARVGRVGGCTSIMESVWRSSLSSVYCHHTLRQYPASRRARVGGQRSTTQRQYRASRRGRVAS